MIEQFSTGSFLILLGLTLFLSWMVYLIGDTIDKDSERKGRK